MLALGLLCAIAESLGLTPDTFTQVRKTPSWPRSWAKSSLISLHSHRNAWANLLLLGQPETFLAAQHLHKGDLGTIRLMRYPPRVPPRRASADPPAVVGISAHTDFVRPSPSSQGPNLRWLSPKAAHTASAASTRRFLSFLIHLIFSYYAVGCMASCMRDHIIRYFPQELITLMSQDAPGLQFMFPPGRNR